MRLRKKYNHPKGLVAHAQAIDYDGDMDIQQTISTSEAAMRNGLSGAQVRLLADRGLIPGAQKIGDRWRIPRTWRHTPGVPGPRPKTPKTAN